MSNENLKAQEATAQAVETPKLVHQIVFDADGVGSSIFQALGLREGAFAVPTDLKSDIAARFKLVDGAVTLTSEDADDDWRQAQIEAEAKEAAERANSRRANMKLTPLEFYGVFTQKELAGIYMAAKEDVNAQIYLDQLKVAQDVTLSDPRTQHNLFSLVAAGLLTQERAEAIIRGEVPA